MRKLLSLLFLIPLVSLAQPVISADISIKLVPDTQTDAPAPTPTAIPSAIELTMPPMVDPDDPFWSTVGDAVRSGLIQDVTLRVTGYGGDVLTGFQFIQNVLEGEKKGTKVHMKVTGPAYSMDALFVCAGTDYSIMPGASLMFHQMAGEGSYIFGLIGTRDTETDPAQDAVQNMVMNLCVSKGLLSNQNVKDILNDHEVYVYPNPDGSLKRITTGDNNNPFLRSVYSLGLSVFFIFALVAGFTYIVRRVGK